ncbi:MAG: hypothetical protein KIT79_15360 [Deltaproteobacteria bacterium]|nr:hypothetical protein [Deltaproteobacteria bacterium]
MNDTDNLYGQLHGLYGDEGMREIEPELGAMPPAEQKKVARHLVRQGRLMRLAARKSVADEQKTRRIGGFDEENVIRDWARRKGIPFERLKIENVRWFHRRYVDIGTPAGLQTSRYAFFSEVPKPGAQDTNFDMWGEWPQTTLVLLRGIMSQVLIHSLGAAPVDRSASGYLSMVQRFLHHATVSYKVDQSTTVTQLLKNLPPAGGANVVNIRDESNGYPEANNLRTFKRPVVIEGGIQYLIEMNVDTGSFHNGGTPVYTDCVLDTVLELDATWIRQAG